MTTRELTNDGWGLETNCFVCEERNDAGLALRIFADDEAGQVVSEFSLGFTHSGSPNVVHGGLSLAVLDEVQAWAVIALAGSWAVTTETAAKFHAPVWIDKPYRAVAEVTGRDGDRVFTKGWIEAFKEGRPGKVCVESTATFAVIGAAVAKEITGVDVSETNKGFVAEGSTFEANGE